MKKLCEYIKDLKIITTKIKNNQEDFEIDLNMVLPLLDILKSFGHINDEEFKMIISNDSLRIKELQHYSFTDFTNVSDEIDDYLSDFTDEVMNLLPQDTDMQSVNFLLYEILINVYKHSRFNNAYLQIIANTNRNIDICIFDDGIGIPGSFKDASIDFDNDSMALYGAINGKTTDKEKYSLHGRGLNSTARLTTLGFNGEMLLASGNGICVITKEGAKTYLNDHEIQGTFVILRINNTQIKNIYKYLKFKNINKVD